METTEKIVEAYVRYVKGWATIPNIKCPGQYEIDLLAINPVTLDRYHIESGISISGSYSKLTSRPFSDQDLKIRVKTAGQRRTLGYFIERKFGAEPILNTLKRYGFFNGKYKKIIVSWDWEGGLADEAAKQNIELWDFRKMLIEIGNILKTGKTYFTDDTLRTLQVYSKATTKLK
jgi:hypothetical protein